jgi:uncharacterized repeat protein (TIGR03837 family)
VAAAVVSGGFIGSRLCRFDNAPMRMPEPDHPARPLGVWDLFCRVVDNFGDIGVCWRLARDLASRGQPVRLWTDDSRSLTWMAPGLADSTSGIELRDWAADADASAWPEPGAVVIEAFGCELPAAFVAGMTALAHPPVWINLEYLSAETYVERSHRLRSPQSGGLDKWFFYPGFTPATGGLLREPGLIARQAGFDADAWLRSRGIVRQPGERLISLFCYPGAGLPELLGALAGGPPTLLLATPGPATEQLQALALTASVRKLALPWLSQDDYDHLLRACDLNCVRGEDSFVRAHWAGRPFLWQIYPQHDGVHAVKVQAFLERSLTGADRGLAASVRAWTLSWNRLSAATGPLPPWEDWQAQTLAWRDSLLAQPDLATQLLDFVSEKR